MKNMFKNAWLDLLLTTRLKRIDFSWEEPNWEEYGCCGTKCLTITAEYKWFWQKKSPSCC